MNKIKSCLCLFFVVLWLCPGFAGAVDVGTEAPGFSLKSVEGESVSLSGFKGKPVLLKIGTTWCPGCKTLSDEVDSLLPFLDEREVFVLDVFIQDTVPMIKKLLEGKERYSRFHALIDDGSVHRGYSVYLIPRLLIVDADQKVRFDSSGRHVYADEIRATIEGLSLNGSADTGVMHGR